MPGTVHAACCTGGPVVFRGDDVGGACVTNRLPGSGSGSVYAGPHDPRADPGPGASTSRSARGIGDAVAGVGGHRRSRRAGRLAGRPAHRPVRRRRRHGRADHPPRAGRAPGGPARGRPGRRGAAGPGRTDQRPARQPPAARRWDGIGRHTAGVAHHPAHTEAGRAIYGTGIMSAYAEVGVDGRAGGTSPRRPVAAAPHRYILTLFYLTAQAGEAGHNCPLACDAGAIRTLQHLGTAEQQSAFLPGLLDPDYDTNLTASQFLTEVQGGSDVGANAVRAVPVGDARRRPGQPVAGQRREVVLLQRRRRRVPGDRPGGRPGHRHEGPRAVPGAPPPARRHAERVLASVG